MLARRQGALSRAIAFLALAIATALPAAAQQAYPQARPVKVVVPFGAGSTPDVITRQLTARLSAHFGQTFIVEMLSSAIAQVSREPAWKQQLTEQGVELLGSSPAVLGQYIASERRKWGALIESRQIRTE